LPVTNHPFQGVSSNGQLITIEGLSLTGNDWPVSTFGDRIRQAREARDWSQAQLAHALGVSPSAIRDWEARERSPRDWRVYRALATELGVSADHLLDVPQPRRGLEAAAAEAGRGPKRTARSSDDRPSG
jgi:transcriptional regulator with XRE-family HTH domain